MRKSSPPDPLDALLGERSGSFAGLAWRGYLSHALLFYRQNDLKGFPELLRLGRRLNVETSREPAVERYLALKTPPQVERALRRDPGDHVLWVLRGLLRHERYWGSLRLGLDSLADFERAAALSPGSVWPHLLAGMALEMRRRYVQASRRFEDAMALRPEWSWPYILRGVCRWYLAEFPDSIRDFKTAARLDPKSDLPLLFLARAKADVRDRSLVKDLDRALKLAPRSGFALSWRGRALFLLKKTPASLCDLKRSIALLPDYDRGWSWLGVSLVEQGRCREAVGLLKKARRLNPYYPTTLYPLAQALLKLGKIDEAGEALKAGAFIDRQGVWVEHRISMSHPNPACLRSLRDLDAYIDRRPREAWAWAWRGQTRLLLQDYRQALSDLDRALGLAPKDAWAWVWRGETERRLGLVEEAARDFKKALRLDGSLSWPRAGLGWCALELGDPKRAVRWLDASLKRQGYCAPALAWRGEALARLGRWLEAGRDLEEALELHPRDHWILERLWVALWRRGDRAGALAALKTYSAARGDESDLVWAWRGWAHGALGEESAAVAALAKALKLNADQPLALVETACWWARQGEAQRARFVHRQGPWNDRPLPRRLSLAQALSLSAEPQGGFTPEPLVAGKACAAAFKKGDLVRALALAQDGPLRRRDIRLYLLRGWLKLRTGDKAGAVEEASRALDQSLDPRNAGALWLRRQARG